jgi:hypothetical protein
LTTVPLGVGNTATDASITDSGKAMPPAQSPNILTGHSVKGCISFFFYFISSRKNVLFSLFRDLS